MQRTIYGVPAKSLDECLDLFMIEQGNSKRSHYLDYMITIHSVWQELFRKTIWDIRQIVVDVDKVNNTVTLPEGIERLISITVVDKNNNMQPIVFDPNMSTVNIQCHNRTCSCETCKGENTLCDAIDSITMRIETIVLNSQIYDIRIWNKRDGASLLEVREAPYVNGDGQVEYHTTTNALYDFELTDKGCIKQTDSNVSAFLKFCGYAIPTCYKRMCPQPILPRLQSGFGYWKPDAACQKIVHLKDVTADKVIISFQPAPGYKNKTVLVPEYGLQALMYGLYYFTMRFDKKVPRGEKRAAELDWIRKRQELFGYMHPINLDDISRLRGVVPKW